MEPRSFTDDAPTRQGNRGTGTIVFQQEKLVLNS